MKGRFRPQNRWWWSLWMAALVVAPQAFGPGIVMSSPVGWEVSGHVGLMAYSTPAPPDVTVAFEEIVFGP